MTCPSTTLEYEKSLIVSPQGQIEVSATESLRETVYVSQQATKIRPNKNGLAPTLMARDYEGFGNQEMNGVIEWKQKD